MHSHVVMLALFAVACGAATASSLPVGTTTTTGGVSNDPGGLGVPQELRESPPRIVLGDDAAAQLAGAHCAHEDACGNVGPAGTFPTLDVCVAAVRTSQRNRFTADCAKGVDPYALDRCLEDMRAEGCDASPSSCASDRLCR